MMSSVPQTAVKQNYTITSPTQQAMETKNPYRTLAPQMTPKPAVSKTPTYSEYIANKAKQVVNSPITQSFVRSLPGVGVGVTLASRYSQPRASTPTPTISTVATTPQVQQPPVAQSPKPDPLLSYYDSAPTGQSKIIDTQSKLDQDFLTKQYETKKALLEGQLPQAQQNFDRFSANVNAGIADQVANTAAEKAAIEKRSGETQKQIADARRAVKADREAQFAGLNTIDSAGAGSFTSANTNDDAAFNRDTTNNLETRDANLNAADRELNQYKREAQGLIDTENAKLQDTIRQIQSDISMTDEEKSYKIQSIYNEAQSKKQGIIDQYNQLKLERLSTVHKPLSPEQQSQISDFDNSINQVNGLTSLIQQYKDKFGPVAGRFNASNVYDTDSQVINSQIKAVAQMVGRALEGGVLRKEDVPKYEAILPNLTDTPEVAIGKINNVIQLLQGQRNTRAQGFGQIGYNTSQPQQQPVNNNDPLGLGF